VIEPGIKAMGGHDPVVAAIPSRQIWCVDFEFRHGAGEKSRPGERPWPVCMAARELRSGREIRLWRDDLLALNRAPFDTGLDSVIVAFVASAELGCFLELGWPLPVNVLDLYVENRIETNGVPTPCGNGLIGALAMRGLGHIDAGEKQSMRRLILDQNHWSDAERRSILEYCASDVEALVALLPYMASKIDWPRALLRGRYMAAVAWMERVGVPIDADTFEQLIRNWDSIKRRLVADVDAAFGVYDGMSFKRERFRQFLAIRRIPWPSCPSGTLKLDADTFKDKAKRWPELQPLRELRATLDELRLTELEVGTDGRNRCSLWPFSAVTGRNQPSNTKFIFGPARWMRGLIRPPEGWGIAYIDFCSQEIGIAAGLSGDERMIEGYLGGDPYLAFAKAAKLAPADATKTSHKLIRDRCKAIVLGINYGMGPNALAVSAGITPAEAKELLRLHRNTYRRFWRWSDDTVSAAMLSNEMRTVFGWRRRLARGRDPNERSLMNFPMQANGAEMMRIAAIAATEAGIEVAAPIHDAFLISAPLDRLDADVAMMQGMMEKAGESVTGIAIRTDAEVVRWPERYMDERGQAMWNRVLALLNDAQKAAA
jgi:DNA polymerase I